MEVTHVKCVCNRGAYTGRIKVGKVYRLVRPIILNKERRQDVKIHHVYCNGTMHKTLHADYDAFIASGLKDRAHTAFVPYVKIPQDTYYELY